jgi:hypothetical protein
MNEEIEIGSLKLTDNSELVLTTLHVFQHQHRGIFGESQTIIPRTAIATVRLRWERSRWLVIAGALLVLLYLVLMISSAVGGITVLSRNPLLEISSSAISFIKYSSLIAGIGLFFLFWFDKRIEIQIAAPSGTIRGMPRSYEEAKTFCSLFIPKIREQLAITKRVEQAAPSKAKTADPDWQF